MKDLSDMTLKGQKLIQGDTQILQARLSRRAQRPTMLSDALSCIIRDNKHLQNYQSVNV